MARDQQLIHKINVIFTASRAGILEIPSPVAGFIGEVYVASGQAVSGSDAFFDLHVAGVSIWDADQSQRLKITVGQSTGSKTGLTAAVAKLDPIRFDYDGGGSSIGGPLTFIITIAETGALLNDEDLIAAAVEAAQDSLGGAGLSVSSPLDKLYDDDTNALTLFIERYAQRKIEATGAQPDASSDTYGEAVENGPSAGFSGMGSFHRVALTSGGVFGIGETLTVRLTVYQNVNPTPAEITKTFMAAAQTIELTTDEIWSLLDDADSVIEIDVDAKSDQASSTATGGAIIYCMNT